MIRYMQLVRYYFGCTVSFDCPICGRASSEKLVYQARWPDPKRIAAAVSKGAFECQQCGAALEKKAAVKIHVLPADEAELRVRGFVLSRAA